MNQNGFQVFRLNCGFEEIFEDDYLFGDLVMYLGSNVLETVGNFHTQNISHISLIEVSVPLKKIKGRKIA